MRILATKLRAIGDTVLWTSALQQLKSAWPSAEIHILTYASNEAVLRSHPTISTFHGLKSKSQFELVRTLMGLRRFRFDWFLGFHATTSLCRWAWLAGSRQMALHHHSRTKTPSGSVPVPEAGRLESALWRDLRLLQALLIPLEVPGATSIFLTEPERQSAERRMASVITQVGGSVVKPRYLFLPGASHPLRRYPRDLWWSLVLREKARQEFQPVVICDSPLSSEWSLRDLCEREKIPLLDHAGLRDFIALISRGQKALANDSGPGHIAMALGVPTDFIFGPGCVGDWHPYDKSVSRVHRAKVDCRLQGPRDRDEFQFCVVDHCEHHRCMRALKKLIDN